MVTKSSSKVEAGKRSRSFMDGGVNKKYSLMEEKT